MLKRALLVLGAAYLLIELSSLFMAPAQPGSAEPQWPRQPIHVLVPFAAAGVADTQMRILGRKLGTRLGQQVVVENRPGASGNLGAQAVARARPDGYTLGFANTSTHVLAPILSPELPYDPVEDFAPVALIGSTPFVVLTNPNVPAKSLQETIALARANPRALRYASAGPATLANLAGVLLQTLTGIELTAVPYRSTGQAAIDLIEGRIEIAFGTIPPILEFVRQGKLRALAVTGQKRSATLPEVPTVEESGVPGYEVVLWQALVAPAGTPPEVIARLSREVSLALGDPDVADVLREDGVEIQPGTPKDLADLIRSDGEKWRSLLKHTTIGAR
jgi:tripartite-type tricarboxylate transporter receptor subunit TctC